ncbi:hypothetical protein [Granulibacter bethesdensis]|nr:hypothetical protein [Granulibacter bethesdensis]
MKALIPPVISAAPESGGWQVAGMEKRPFFPPQRMRDQVKKNDDFPAER